MAKPQCEDGYTRIADELLDEIIKYKLSGEKFRCFFMIIRKTYGYNKTEDAISLSQFEEGTGIKSRSVRRALSCLESSNLIFANRSKGRTTKYKINKNWEDWKKPTLRTDAHSPCATTRTVPCAYKRNTIDSFIDTFKDNSPASGDMPSKDTIKNAAPVKLKTEIETLSEDLYKSGKFLKVHAWVNRMRKLNKNNRAILHTLMRCYSAKKSDGNLWGYCTKIINVEDGNFNESDFTRTK